MSNPNQSDSATPTIQKVSENNPLLTQNSLSETETNSSNKGFFSRLTAKANNVLDAFFEPARTANALGNGAISASAVKSNIFLLILGLLTGMINSYAAGEARETDKIQAPVALWWTDRLTALIYGIGCGATTAASTYQIFTALSLLLGGVWGLISFGVLMGVMTLIASYKKLGFAKAMLLACAITALYIGISYAIIGLAGISLLAPILLVSTYFLSAVLGFCTTILNYGITQNSIISLIMGDKADHKKGQAKKTTQEQAKQAREKTNFYILVTLAGVSCLASGCAIGGLTYISIMALPAAFGFSMPVAALLTLAIFIAAVTTCAMVPLLIKQCLPIAKEWAKVSLTEIPGIIKKQLKDLFIFNPEIYQDTFANRAKFYLKALLLTLIVPIAITGSVLTMLQASEALSDVIKNIIQLLTVKLKTEDDKLAEGLAFFTLGGALTSDLIFSVSTAFSWMSRISPQAEKIASTTSTSPSITSLSLPSVVPSPHAATSVKGGAKNLIVAAADPSPISAVVIRTPTPYTQGLFFSERGRSSTINGDPGSNRDGSSPGFPILREARP